jgi:hypothetical protein
MSASLVLFNDGERSSLQTIPATHGMAAASAWKMRDTLSD